MIDGFKPPIKTRTTAELLEIVGSPKKWNPDAITLARNELSNRNVETTEIEQAVQSAIENEEAEKFRKANQSYKITDFIFRPMRTFFEIIFTWELKKDGYHLKAKQQQSFWITLFVVIGIVYTLSYVFG